MSEEVANNVIEFPIYSEKVALANLHLQEQLKDNQMEYIDAVIENVTYRLTTMLAISGFDIYSEEFANNLAYSVEAIRHTLMASLNIQHDLAEHFKEGIEMCQFEYDEELDDEGENEI